MRVRLGGERDLDGTPRQIVQSMRAVSVAYDKPLNDYIDLTILWASQMGTVLRVVGETEDERCESLVDEMVRTGLAEELD